MQTERALSLMWGLENSSLQEICFLERMLHISLDLFIKDLKFALRWAHARLLLKWRESPK